jgi:hypothetical protein
MPNSLPELEAQRFQILHRFDGRAASLRFGSATLLTDCSNRSLRLKICPQA